MCVVLVLGALTLAPAVWGAAKKPAPTIRDLQSRPVEVRKDTKVEASATRAMENYRHFLELQRTDPGLRAEALRRLGDLELEAGELERMEKEVSALDLSGAEAIRLYTTLLAAYPGYPRNDQVLYQLARAYETTGQPEQALVTLDRIIGAYPGSPQLDEVQFRRGEILFSAKRYADAERAYAAVIARGSGSRFFAQSLYKHGWSLFKQSLNEESLESFAGVLDQTLVDRRERGRLVATDTLSRADRELVEDTLRAMSITFSYLDGAQTLDAFAARRPPMPYAHLLYARLGDLYVEKQRYQDAAATYRAYVNRQPNSDFAPGLAMQAIEACRKGGFAQLVLEGKREYVEHYGFSAPFWQDRDRRSPAWASVVAELETNLMDVARYYHATAQASRRIEDYQQAARWYRDYLQFFPDDPRSAATNQMLAETLFESHQYAEATTEFERTAYDYPKSERSAGAAHAALVAAGKHEEGLTGAERAAWHARSVDAALRFAETFPEHPESAVALTRAAQDIFSAGDLPRAVQVSERILARQPPVDQAKRRIAWTIIGQSQFDLGAFDRAESAFVEARALLAPDDAMQGDLTERIAATVYRQGEAKRTAGDGTGAIEDFLRVGRLAPGSKIRATAQYDAAAQLVQLRDWGRAIEVLEGYRRDFPGGEFAAEVTRNLAVAYSEAGRPGDAAVELERIAASPAEEGPLRREALLKAADLYEKARNLPKSTTLLEQFITRYPAPAGEAIEVRQRLADLAAREGRSDRQEYWEREIVQADRGAGAARSDRTRYLAAKSQLALAAGPRDAFRAIRLRQPLKKSVAAKRNALEAALVDYRAAADYGIAEVTTAAVYEMAELYRTLGRDLLASERPKGMGADELAQYDVLLEEQAFPFEEQAIKTHEINAARAREGLYDESVKKSFAALAELKPGRYGMSELLQDVAGDPTQAELALRETLQAAPQDAASWTRLGVLLRMQGRFKEALEAYEAALAADPDFAPAHRNLGVLSDLYLGDAERALASFERYRALGGGEDRQLNGWIADLRQRLGRPAPAAAGEQ